MVSYAFGINECVSLCAWYEFAEEQVANDVFFCDIVAQNYSDQPLVSLEHAPVLYHLCQAYKTDLTWRVSDSHVNRHKCCDPTGK